jgi:hypothetical protein
LCGCASFIDDTLRRALVEGVPRSLEPCHGRRVGVTGPDIQPLAILAGFVRVHQAKVLIETLVERCRRGAADGCEQAKAKRE